MILLLDIGFSNTGWSIIKPTGKQSFKLDDWGCIRTKRSIDDKTSVALDDARRNAYMFNSLLQVCFNGGFITGVAIELPTSGGQSAVAVKGMAMASAVAACFVNSTRMKHIYVKPNDVKRVVKPKGKVSKEEVMDFVRARFSDCYFTEPKCEFEHIADSVCVGLHLKGTEWFEHQYLMQKLADKDELF